MKKVLVEKQNNNDESYILNDLIKNKSEVKSGDLLFSLETSKAVVDVNSDYDGFILLNPNIKEGSSVVVGEVIAVISDNKNISFDFKIINTDDKDQNPGNFTKTAYKYAIENNLNISDYSTEEIVTLDMLQSKNEIFEEKIVKPKIAIVGASGQGLEVLSIIKRQSNFEFSGFIDVKFPDKKKYNGYEIIGNDNNYEEIYKKGIHNIVIAGGWLKDPKIISNIFNKSKFLIFLILFMSPQLFPIMLNLVQGFKFLVMYLLDLMFLLMMVVL